MILDLKTKLASALICKYLKILNKISNFRKVIHALFVSDFVFNCIIFISMIEKIKLQKLKGMMYKKIYFHFLFIEPYKKAWLAFFVVKSAMKIFWQLEKDIHKIRTQCVIHVINDCMLYCIRVSCIIVWRFYSGFFYVKKKISTQQKMNYECKKRIHIRIQNI